MTCQGPVPMAGNHENEPKRPRLALQTPQSGGINAPIYSTPMPTDLRLGVNSVQPTGDILDYLKGRGGRIKELEDEVAKLKHEKDQLNSELQRRLEKNAVLEIELKGAKAVADAARASASSSLGQSALADVERLLEVELAKVVLLEDELAAARDQLSAAREETAQAKASLRLLNLDFTKQLNAANLQAEKYQRQVQLVQSEGGERVKAAELQAKLEKRKRETDQELARAVQKQLQEARQEARGHEETISQLRNQLAELRRSIAPSSSSLQTPAHAAHRPPTAARVSQLEHQLRAAQAEVQALRSGAAGAGAGAGLGVGSPTAGAGPAGQRDMAGSFSLAADENAMAGLTGLRMQVAQLQAQLQAWESGPMQQALKAMMDASAPAAAAAGSVPGGPGSGAPAPSSAAAVATGAAGGGGKVCAADAAARAINALVAEWKELRSCVLEGDTKIMEMKVVADAAEKELKGVAERAQEVAAQVQRLASSERALEQRLAAVSGERDALRRALAAPAPIANMDSLSGRLEAAQQVARVAELQRLNVEQQDRIAKLQGEVEAAAAAAAAAQQAVAGVVARAEAAEGKVVQLEKEADSLARDVASLQEKLGRGEVNRSSVRVLHLKLNPESEAQQQSRDVLVNELRTENQALKESLQRLSVQQGQAQGGGHAAGQQQLASAAAAAAGAGPGSGVLGGSDMAGGASGGASGGGGGGSAAELAVREAEIAVLRHRVGELEKGMVRLKEVTKERIMAFREAAYCLFGYRVDMTAEVTAAKDAATAPTTFSLKPQHADDPNAMLVFRYSKARGMELVPNAFSSKMSREVDTFVRKFNSIPAFTANLTIENFQKMTVC